MINTTFTGVNCFELIWRHYQTSQLGVDEVEMHMKSTSLLLPGLSRGYLVKGKCDYKWDLSELWWCYVDIQLSLSYYDNWQILLPDSRLSWSGMMTPFLDLMESFIYLTVVDIVSRVKRWWFCIQFNSLCTCELVYVVSWEQWRWF